jgi:NADPH-dependent 2,4-dienoyl-CoA reductase/sulfur reductase-like enzyme
MSIVIVGAGLAGGTAATELRERGYDGAVVLIGAEDHPPYERPPLSKGYLLGNDPLEDAFVHPREWYPEHDVDLRLGVHATSLDTGTHTVQTSAGEVGYDRLLLATGAEPRRLELAEQSGVPTAYLRTIEDSDRLKAAFARGGRIVVVGAGWIGLEAAAAARSAGCDVTVIETAALPLLRVLGPTAAGDFANHDHPVLGRRIRVEHWDTAINQAKVAAHNLAGGDEPYEEMPYFFTDQYDLGMEYVGHGSADDEVVVHGNLKERVFRAFWVREGRVVAAMHANDWDATDDLRAAVASGDLPPAAS